MAISWFVLPAAPRIRDRHGVEPHGAADAGGVQTQRGLQVVAASLVTVRAAQEVEPFGGPRLLGGQSRLAASLDIVNVSDNAHWRCDVAHAHDLPAFLLLGPIVLCLDMCCIEYER